MKDKNSHTFIVLAFEKSPHLNSCIVSLLQQTIKSDILISTSTPSGFIEKISQKFEIPLILNRKGGGIASDWSFAYNNANTKFVTLAHQDDLYRERYTEECLKYKNLIRRSLILFTDYIELYDGRLRVNNLFLSIKRLILNFFFAFKNRLSSEQFKKLMFSFGNPICCPSIMYNKENIGDFEFNKSFFNNLDWEAGLRLSKKKGDYVYIKKKLVVRRIHEASATTKAIRDNIRYAEDQRLFEFIWPKPVAKILLSLYSKCYKYNELKNQRPFHSIH